MMIDLDRVLTAEQIDDLSKWSDDYPGVSAGGIRRLLAHQEALLSLLEMVKPKYISVNPGYRECVYCRGVDHVTTCPYNLIAQILEKAGRL